VLGGMNKNLKVAKKNKKQCTVKNKSVITFERQHFRWMILTKQKKKKS
jgi:hypothetical protein